MARRSRTSRPKVGDAVQCNFGGDTWYDAIVVSERHGTATCYSAAAATDREGHEGNDDSDAYGCWHLYDHDEGDEWRMTKGLRRAQNPATNMVRGK